METLFTPEELAALPGELDAAMAAHLAWTQRLLRCAMLREMPGEDTLKENAHALCAFGRWFTGVEARLARLEPVAVETIHEAHTLMHQAVRELCSAALAGEPADPAWFAAFQSNQATLVRELTALKESLVRSHAQTDPLTGLPLRHNLPDIFALRRADAERSGTALFVAMADADHFKAINDTYGHAAGDAALVHLAGLLKSTLRGNDTLFRYGGEEFLLLLYGVSRKHAANVATRLLQAVRGTPLILGDGRVLSFTVSLGMSEVRPDDTLDDVIARADAALYAAKTEGRDRYVID
jgi:diguanylate cyclase (GGDEF)-like protein